MASCLPLTIGATSPSAIATNCIIHKCSNSSSSILSFRLSPKLYSSFFTKVAVGGSLNVMATKKNKSTVASSLSRNEEAFCGVPATEESSSDGFITQVSTLIKVVGSENIVELKLKQHDFEATIVIRKKEIPQSPYPGIVNNKQTKLSHPSLRSPLAGTFYRSPSPGDPPFVKVGDKVKEGQVLCIVQAMNLKNEIKTDHSGTIVDVLVDDGKPVSVDTPLFVIEP